MLEDEVTQPPDPFPTFFHILMSVTSVSLLNTSLKEAKCHNHFARAE